MDLAEQILELHEKETHYVWIGGEKFPVERCAHCADNCHSSSGRLCDDTDGLWPCPTARLALNVSRETKEGK